MADGDKMEARKVTKRGVFLYGRRYMVCGRRDIVTNSREMAACLRKYEGRVVHVFFLDGSPDDHLYGMIGKEVVHLHFIKRAASQVS
jgi:hypothetical protein